MLWESGTAKVQLLCRAEHFCAAARAVEELLSSGDLNDLAYTKELIAVVKELMLEGALEHAAKVCFKVDHACHQNVHVQFESRLYMLRPSSMGKQRAPSDFSGIIE